ncbi:MAG: hypothetical protein JNM10_10085 [Planctomycetia bacterium]|nr:hypothetical protein [Planctomycetia bacterium]
MPVRSRSLRFGVLEAVLLASVAGGAAIVLASREDGLAVVEREQAVLADVAALERAEGEFRAAGRRDDDGDGTPEYGSLEDLVAAGLVPGPVLRDLDGPHLRRGSYRLEVLLPSATLPTGEREWGRGGSAVDPKLAAATFAVVARPVRGEARVLRSFYVDGAGYAFTAEGVNEADRDPTVPPPQRELRGDDERGGHEDGPIWRPTRKPQAAAAPAAK